MLCLWSANQDLTDGIVLTGMQFHILLCPYFCFISVLYLKLYVHGNDTLIC